ncbi:TPA: hypothetical protein I7709_20775 [Vibrio vulnificus]|nr:hypothetical protein [Vibrio vulnificus]
MADPFDPNNPNTFNPSTIDARFAEIKQQELSAAQEAELKSTARSFKRTAVTLSDDLNRRLHEQTRNQDWEGAMKTSQDLDTVKQSIDMASKFSDAVESRFRGLGTRKEKLTEDEKRKIYHAYHGSDDVTQDTLASDYRKPQSSIQSIVTADPSKYTKK